MAEENTRIRRPERRNTLAYRVYCDLVCRMRVCLKKKDAIRESADHFGIKRRIVFDVYNRYIRKSLASGCLVRDLR